MTAGARRIGHGTSLAFELGMDGLLATMRRRQVAVEISLTSSDVILGVRGKDHPLPTYLAAGCRSCSRPTTPACRGSTSANEYLRAAREHGLGYRTLKAIARNALIHSFLPPADQRRELERFDRRARRSNGRWRADAGSSATWRR